MVGKSIGKFKVVAEIGRGGMGVVYKAVQTSLGRTVALKMLPPQLALSQEFLERFQSEARILARLNHKNIVHIYDLEEIKGSYFIVMEFIEGESLAKVIAREAPLSTAFIKRVAMETASALSAAHKAGIIHRDIKPENIMIDTYGEVKVMDFGIARAADQTSKTQTGVRLGTPEYMSPEQAKGLRAGIRSDIYSLGIVLYEMACGQVPFSGEDSLAIALKHINEMPVPPSKTNPRVNPELEKIILKSLEKDQSQRYQDANELYQALNKIPIAEEEEIQAIGEKEGLKFMYCPSCGALLEEGYLRCPKCNLVVRRQCPYCLEIFDAVYEVCPHCSRELPLLREESVPRTIIEKALEQKEVEAKSSQEKLLKSHLSKRLQEVLRRALLIFAQKRSWLFLGVAFFVFVAIFLILVISNKRPPAQAVAQLASIPSDSATPPKPEQIPTPKPEPTLKKESPPGLNELRAMLIRARDYFDQGAYDLCIEQVEEILRWKPDDQEALDLSRKAKEIKPKVELYLNSARKALQEGRYVDCLKECEKILAISPKHFQAQNLFNLAKAQVPAGSVFSSQGEEAAKKISSWEEAEIALIKGLIERQRKAMETENISLLLQDVIPELHQEIRRDAEAFFSQNQIIKVSFSKINIRLLEAEAEVSLNSSISYLPVGTQEVSTQTLDVTWYLKKINGNWKITRF